ncbi:MAG: 6-pyruvoyl-tetrahydropterin synthase-related protein [Actinomycetota bacterium]|nr:6-pyruvoyl-tetrahydropterin synthase-related protein [Actinomycetota bacterium]
MQEEITIEKESAFSSKSKISSFVLAIGFATIYGVLFYFFKPGLIFSATTTAGGDTGAHIYVADYLINHLLPKGRITGWSPGWYAGFPMLHFYFPLPFLIIALLSAVIKFQVAFKIGTILGTFLLPITTYAAFRLAGFKFPFPLMAAAFTLPFLFMESYSIYGGNILSTLAGEFSYSLSLSLSILFIALLYRDIKENRFRASTGILLSLIVLSHIVTTIVIIILSSYYLINKLNLKQFSILAGVYALGFGLSAFWLLPFAAKIGYTAHMQWDPLKGLDELFPLPIRPFLILTAAGLTRAIVKKDNRMYLYIWTVVVLASLFFLLPPGRLWNGRILPYFHFFLFIWAAYGIWSFREAAAKILGIYVFLPKRYTDSAAALISLAIVVVSVFSLSQVASAWIKWNYSGFEKKEHWFSFNKINQYIKKLPPGRVMIEHSLDIDTFGTPRAFELLPYFTNHPTMEGTLMEASISAPFHFINQAELSYEPSNAILGIKYPPLNIDAGVKHLKLYNIKYFLALSTAIKRKAEKNHSLKLLKKFPVPKTKMEFALYEIDTDGYVTIPKYRPLLIKGKDWQETVLAWYSKINLLDIPLVNAESVKKAKERRVFALAGQKSSLKTLNVHGARVTNVKITDDEIKFTTNAVGVPHWVKISYFPNWKAEGAEGPYLASPSLMMVVPKQKHVRLYYGSTWSDTAGVIISAISWLFAILYGILSLRRRLSLQLSAHQVFGHLSCNCLDAVRANRYHGYRHTG